MRRKPIYHFDGLVSLGIDKVPNDAKVVIKDATGGLREVLKTANTGMTSVSTIADFLADSGLYKELVDEVVETFTKDGTDYAITLNTGVTLKAPISVDIGLPVGAVNFSNTISGSFAIVHDGTGEVDGTVTKYEHLCNEQTLTVADYPYLGVAGRNLVLVMNNSIGYNMECTQTTPAYYWQWGTILYVNGVIVKDSEDGYMLNNSGFNSGMSDNSVVTVVTDGNDIVLKSCYVYLVTTANATIGDTLNIDVTATTVTFAGE